MKKIFINILGAVLIAALSLRANPVAPRLFSELLIDSTNWALELDIYRYGMGIKLDSCYFATSSGQAKIKPCQLINYKFYILTKDSLESALEINREGDFLQIVGQSGAVLDYFVFSGIPRTGWSICFNEYFTYWDSSPTIGYQNDFDGATGVIHGAFVDSSGSPVSDLTVYWGYEFWPDYYLPIDSMGHFSVEVLATTVKIFVDENDQWQEYSVTVFPEETVTVTLIFQKSSSVEHMFSPFADDYLLFDNFPNPFNSITRIQYHLPRDNFVEINIYDLRGRLVETVFSGFQAKGNYSLIWDAFDAPSGIYIYQLRTKKFVRSKKCLLIR